MNTRHKQYCGYKPELQGAGLRLAHMEYNASDLFATINVNNPLNWSSQSADKDEPRDYNHVFKTASIYREALPKLTIDFLPQTDEGFKYALKGNYDLVSFSGYQCIAEDPLEQELAKKVLMLISAGNNGSEGEGFGVGSPARNNWWMACGAAHMEDNGLITIPEYSGYGAGAVKFVALDDLQWHADFPSALGTSLSMPFAGVLILQYMEAFKLRFGSKPTPKETITFIMQNLHPVTGDKIREGGGLLTLPDFNTYNFGLAFKKDSPTVNVNGVAKVLEAPMKIFTEGEVITKEMAGRSMLPLAGLREAGFNVTYHEDIKSVILQQK